MATAAARARKRDLGPDWRDALAASVRRFALRSWGALLVAVSVAGALALATHSSTDPSFTTAAGGPPTNWLGSVGAYASDALLLLFGLGSVLLLPVVALAGLRMLRLEPSGRIGRGLMIAATPTPTTTPGCDPDSSRVIAAISSSSVSSIRFVATAWVRPSVPAQEDPAVRWVG